MPQRGLGKTSLVVDAFAAIDRDTPLIVRWRDLELPDSQANLLDDLLDAMGYLGRAESWVECRRLTPADDFREINCQPGTEPIDHYTGEVLGEVVSLHSPVSAGKYAERRSTFTEDAKQAEKLAPTLPESFLGALSLDTADLQKRHWSAPPASQQVSYLRPLDALRPKRMPRDKEVASSIQPTTVRFLLIGKPLPRVEDSLRIGELMRLTVMSAFGKDDAGKRLAPWHISGHDLPDDNVHQHAFYLPFDSNGDGRLDRVVLHVPCGFGNDRQVIGQFSRQRKRLRERNGGEWRLMLEGMGNEEVAGPLAECSRRWTSVTPYLHPWHTKKQLGVEAQIRRECRLRGLPEIVEMEPKETVQVGSRPRRPIHFRRFRSTRKRQEQPDRLGGFWDIRFSEPVRGPLALGFACHFGLGLFRPKS